MEAMAMDRNELSAQRRQYQESIVASIGQYRINCASCKGAVYAWDAPLGDCEECRNRKANIEKAIAQSIGGWKPFVDFTLESYAASASNHSALEAARDFKPDAENLFFFGPCGTGKTHLAVASIRRHWRRGVEFVQPAQIFRRIRGQSGEDEQGEIDRLASLYILAIDDLGAEKITEFSAQVLYDIIDRRLMNFRSGLVVTSNLTIAELAERLGDDRIPSRLAGACRVIEVSGNDQRGARKPRFFDTSWRAKLASVNSSLGCDCCKRPEMTLIGDRGGYVLSLHRSMIPCESCNPMHPKHPGNAAYLSALRLRQDDYSSREAIRPAKSPAYGYSYA
jgi:DNA replication protein DnaC